MFRSSRVVLEDKLYPKIVALSIEETAIVQWAWRSQRWTEIVNSTFGQRQERLILRRERYSHFPWMKEYFTSPTIDLH